jgi:hypothetical protein
MTISVAAIVTAGSGIELKERAANRDGPRVQQGRNKVRPFD